MTQETRRTRPRMWARRRWGFVRIAVMVSAIASVVPFLAFLAGDEDPLLLVIVLAGIPGALSALRLLGIRAHGTTSAYRRSAALPDDDYRPGRLLFGDLGWAAVVWLVGAEIVSIAALVSGVDDGTVLLAPLFVGMLWVMGVAVGSVIGVLISGPLAILLDAFAARGQGRPFHRGWYIAAAFFPLLLVWAVASFFAATAVSEATGTPTRDRGLLIEILFIDVSGFDPGVQVSAWTARVCALFIVALLVFAAFDGREDRRLDREALLHGREDGAAAGDSTPAE